MEQPKIYNAIREPNGQFEVIEHLIQYQRGFLVTWRDTLDGVTWKTLHETRPKNHDHYEIDKIEEVEYRQWFRKEL